MAARRPKSDAPSMAAIRAELERLDAGPAATGLARPFVAAAVRSTLAELAARYPGHLVEVRVPPWGAVQVGVPGLTQVHRRGTPPNVVECAPDTWLRLATGLLTWDAACATHRVSASGAHAELGDLLPLA